MATDVSVSFGVFQLAVLVSVLLSIHLIVFYRARMTRSDSSQSDVEARKEVERKEGDPLEAGGPRKRPLESDQWARVPYVQENAPTEHRRGNPS